MMIHTRAIRLRTHASLLAAFVLGAIALQAGGPEFEEDFAARRWAEAEADATARLQQSTADAAEASADLARVIVASRQRERFDEAVRLLERAVAADPRNAAWHFHLGETLGRMARSSGVGGLGAAGRSRAAFERAVALEPGNFEYVYALNEFYLEAPGIAGGSVRKARQAADRFAAVDPAGAVILGAQVLAHQGEAARAIRDLLALERRDDNSMDVVRRMILVSAGLALVEAGKAREALPAFERVTTEFPNNAPGLRGYGRALLEVREPAAAVGHLDRASQIDGAAESWYWLGVAYQATGDKDNARRCLGEAIGRGANGRQADDARNRLRALGD
jgi:tetratricopeptide (TPR) repeat protein